MCKFSSKSGGVPFQISFFLGDLTRNDPLVSLKKNVATENLKKIVFIRGLTECGGLWGGGTVENNKKYKTLHI